MIEDTMEKNRPAVLDVEERVVGSRGLIGVNGFRLFPVSVKRAGRGKSARWLGLQSPPERDL